jgi:hypothetical protein
VAYKLFYLALLSSTSRPSQSASNQVKKEAN